MRLIELFKQLPQPYFLVDQVGFQLVFMNRAAEKLLDSNLDQFVESRLWLEKIHPALIDESKGEVTIHHDHSSYDLQYSVCIDTDQSIIAVHISKASPSPDFLHNFYGLIDNLGAYVYCKDLSFRYTYANRKVCEMFGMTLDQVIGEDDRKFFGEETATRIVEDADKHVIKEQKTIEQHEINFIPSLNEYRHYLSVKKPLYDSNNHVVGIFGISTDISELKNTQRMLAESEQKLSTILDNVGAHIFIKDTDLKFCYINKSVQELFQRSEQEIIGKSLTELFDDERAQACSETDEQVFTTGKKVSCIESLNILDETRFYWTVKIPQTNEQGEVFRYIGIATDITEQKRLETQVVSTNERLKTNIKELSRLKNELQQQANHDGLTGLFNRRYWEQHASLAYHDVDHGPTSLLMIDIDQFKQINDSFGHSLGDDILVLLSRVMKEECRSDDLICRYGGDEFLIQLHSTSGETALRRAERIRKRYQESVKAHFSGMIDDTVSIGVATSPDNGQTFKDVYQAADRALYRAKGQGRNRCVLASS